MKRNIFALLSIFALFSCNKEIDSIKHELVINRISVSLDNTMTKTTLGEGNNVLWNDGDAISIFDDAGENQEYILETGAGLGTATFTGPACTPKYALYPYNSSAEICNSIITFDISASQTYVPESFANNANIAVAIATNPNNIHFNNVCGVLCLRIKGSYRVSKIVLTSKDASENLCGKFSVDATDPNTLNYISDGSNSITLDCGNVQLNPAAVMPFYIIVPAGALSSGFTATIYDDATSYDNYFEVIQTSKDQTIQRNYIRKMESKTISHLASISNVDEVEYIEGNGRNLINSGCYATQNTRVRGRVNSFGYSRTFLGVWTEPKFFVRVFGASSSNQFWQAYCDTWSQNAPLERRDWSLSSSWDTFDLSYYSGFYLNGTQYRDGGDTHVFTTTVPMGIMGGIKAVETTVSESGMQGYDIMYAESKMGILLIWESGALVHYFIPCITTGEVIDIYGDVKPSGTVGLYDFVSDKLYTKAKETGLDYPKEFSAGPIL